MKAWYIAAAGEGTRLEARDVPAPQPKAGEILVKVRASSLNRGEFIAGHGVVLAAGATEAKPCGGEAAGEVLAVGEGVTAFRPGDKVIGRCRGGFAEQAVIDAREAMPMPTSLSWEEAAAIPLVSLVSYDMLVEQGRLAAGEWVVITGVTSGVGVASLQIAKALGAKVIGTTRDAAKLAPLAKLGLDASITGAADLKAEILRITGGKGCDIVINNVGGSVFPACIEALAYKGRLATVGYVDGVMHADLDIGRLHSQRLSVYGVSNKNRTAAERAVTVAGFARDVLPLFDRQGIKPLVDRVYPLDELPAAKARMEANQHVGKIAVRV